jgi:DNA-binding NarL/FixJ family response regulator
VVAAEALTSESAGPRARKFVALVADDPGVRRRVAANLGAAGISVVIEAKNAASLVAELRGRPLGAVVVAPREGTSGTAQVTELRRRLRDVAIVAVITTTDQGEPRRAISAGADGAVLERDLDEALVATVLAAAAGQISFPEAQGAQDRPSLTRRERQVLRNVARGLTNAEVAHELGLAESTVKSHLSSAFAKLGVASRAEAAALIRDPVLARSLGALRPESEASE